MILVDWSDVTEDRAFQKIRASVAVEGRALTLVSVAALASLVPAIRAIRQDPVRALRSP